MADDEIRIQLRRGTATKWSNVNPVLAVGEPGFDTSNGILKIGDGTTRWASLSGVNDSNYIVSDNSVASGSDIVTNVISLTQEEYDLITPESGIVYLISGGSTAITSGDNISLLTNDSSYVASDVAGITGASGVSNIVQISQTDYDALGTYDQNTIYFIV